MAYTNSPLVVYTNLSSNHSGQRTHSIDRITPHCVVGQLSCVALCRRKEPELVLFQCSKRSAGYHYRVRQ